MLTIAVANAKGGSAKTTTAIHLAAGHAQRGARTLLVDLDPQGHAGEGLGLPFDRFEPGLAPVLTGQATIAEVVQRELRPRLAIVPATRALIATEYTLRDGYNRERRLRCALDAAAGDYDLCVLDCPPAFNLLTVNALTAAETVLIPMVADYYALRGVDQMLESVAEVARHLNRDLAIWGLLITRYGRTVNAREVAEAARERFASRLPIFAEPVAESVRFREAAALGKTIDEHAPTISGAAVYRALRAEVSYAR